MHLRTTTGRTRRTSRPSRSRRGSVSPACSATSNRVYTVQIDGNTTYATYESDEYDPGPGGGSVWYRYTSPSGGFAGRLGYRATPGFFVACRRRTHRPPSRGGRRATRRRRHRSTSCAWNRVTRSGSRSSTSRRSSTRGRSRSSCSRPRTNRTESPFARSGTGEGEFALVDDFNLLGDGDTHHLTPDLGGAPNGWSTLRFDVPGSLTVTYRSSTAATADGQGGPDVGSERPLGLRVYRSPQATRLSDPTVLGAPIALGTSRISSDPAAGANDHGHLVRDVRRRWPSHRAATTGRSRGIRWPDVLRVGGSIPCRSTIDAEPPTATITTPPDGATYTVGSVPSTVVFTCTDNQGPTTSFVTVDGAETTTLATALGGHTVSLECTDSGGQHGRRHLDVHRRCAANGTVRDRRHAIGRLRRRDRRFRQPHPAGRRAVVLRRTDPTGGERQRRHRRKRSWFPDLARQHRDGALRQPVHLERDTARWVDADPGRSHPDDPSAPCWHRARHAPTTTTSSSAPPAPASAPVSRPPSPTPHSPHDRRHERGAPHECPPSPQRSSDERDATVAPFHRHRGLRHCRGGHDRSELPRRSQLTSRSSRESRSGSTPATRATSRSNPPALGPSPSSRRFPVSRCPPSSSSRRRRPSTGSRP